ncbi:BtpA/SgcQ family protein [Galbitalea sp. SE-J8]|uniref:BtpA/SgcQ family protein n=1 Tax=Galbitalea sp. SE-J8 TaxID=3054952 RepID=UPI00259CCC2A|nr:BtpA/SgcQ family protein [Galbitalea sp. SE-J8]MDM4764204.1 BtpA/SgcQ family protein [Galbitalea sp. SE-J8]
MNRFQSIFPAGTKPIIAMAHLPALPGTPLYDAGGGVSAIIDRVHRDVEILVDAGFDAVMFCNENDRPYELHGGPESAAVMARVVTECRPAAIPFGVDFLWDARIALAVAVATGASFLREVVSGVWESDMGLWNTDVAALLRERRRLDADDVAVLMNVAPEFASPIGGRSFSQIARSTVVSSLADAILVSGPMAGAGPSLDVLREVREAVPEQVPVILNTGARAETIGSMLDLVDGCIVGSSLKVDGHTWNAVEPDRAHRFVDAARA